MVQSIEIDDLLEERIKMNTGEVIDEKHEPLITKYRPLDFSECYGHSVVIDKLKMAVSSQDHPHCFLFTGPSGVGKTTIARIIANKVNATTNEIDAGTNSGIDFTKELVFNSGFKPLELEPGKPNSLIIVDECHALSKAAWSPLLKLTEEPPKHLYIAFCTTDPQKVPETIQTRCYRVDLKPIHSNDIDQLVTDIATLEGWELVNEVANGIILAAEGSARRAISLLQAGHSCKDLNELSQIVANVVTEDSPEIQIAIHFLSGKRNWRTIQDHLKRIQDFDAAVVNVTRYIAGAIVKSDDQQAHEHWIILQKFMRDVSWDKKVQFYSAIGSVMWGSIPF